MPSLLTARQPTFDPFGLARLQRQVSTDIRGELDKRHAMVQRAQQNMMQALRIQAENRRTVQSQVSSGFDRIRQGMSDTLTRRKQAADAEYTAAKNELDLEKRRIDVSTGRKALDSFKSGDLIPYGFKAVEGGEFDMDLGPLPDTSGIDEDFELGGGLFPPIDGGSRGDGLEEFDAVRRSIVPFPSTAAEQRQNEIAIARMREIQASTPRRIQPTQTERSNRPGLENLFIGNQTLHNSMETAIENAERQNELRASGGSTDPVLDLSNFRQAELLDPDAAGFNWNPKSQADHDKNQKILRELERRNETFDDLKRLASTGDERARGGFTGSDFRENQRILNANAGSIERMKAVKPPTANSDNDETMTHGMAHLTGAIANALDNNKARGDEITVDGELMTLQQALSVHRAKFGANSDAIIRDARVNSVPAPAPAPAGGGGNIIINPQPQPQPQQGGVNQSTADRLLDGI